MGNPLLNGKKVILVEDDVELASLVQEFLGKNGYLVEVVTNGIDATQQIIEQQPDLVILDIMLPGQSGMDVCRVVRRDYTGLILMLTSLDEDMDQMLGLELGADDYVIKPVKPRLLLSRIKALLRRAETSQPLCPSATSQIKSTLRALSVDVQKRSISVDNQNIQLTTAEYDLLNLLIHHAGKIVTRELILQRLRGFEYDGLDRSIDRRISRLRKKLNDDPVDPQIIKTIRSKGYLLCAHVQKTMENESIIND